MKLSKEVRQKTIADLKKYPDWIVRIECAGLGGEPCTIGGYWEDGFSTQNKEWRNSVIENFIEYDDEVRRRIFAIERVFERLKIGSNKREIIRLRYLLQDYTAQEIQDKLNIPERTYFNLHNSALISFARALGYII